MKLKWSRCVVVRHAGDESVVWAPRTDSISLLMDARPFLEAITIEWQEEDLIGKRIAENVGLGVDEIRPDLNCLTKELESQGFVVSDQTGKGAVKDGYASIEHQDKSGETEEGILVSFCERNHIATELHLDLTDVCTEKCVHCYVPQKVRHFLPYERVDKVLREFRAQNGFTVYLTGGECMLHPDFKKICRLCVELNLNMVVMTNLTCCDDEMVRFLREVDPQYLNVSLYSMKASEHDAVTRLPGSWQKTMAAILACEKAGVHIRIATPLLKENQGAFAELKKFAGEHHMHLIPSCDIVAMTDHDCSNMEHACSCSELKAALGKYKEIFDRGWDGILPKCDAKVCDIGTSRLYVNAKGDYYPCDSMHGYVLGNVATYTVTEVWKGDKLTYLRGLKNRDFGKCASCENRPWCKVCPAANFNATGDLFRPHESACARAAVIREVYGKGE